MPKFFITKHDICDGIININGDNANHISNVLRAKINDKIVVCDGECKDYNCVITQISKNTVIAKIIETTENLNEPNIKITLYQSLPKGDKMEMVIQKCIEIGVDKIVPINTENCVVKLSNKEEKKLVRWNKIAEAAAKQCGRGKIPIVDKVMNFKDAILQAKFLDAAIIPYEREKQNNIKSFINNFSGKSIGIFIGSEGGFSQDEIKFAVDNGIHSVTLGNRILRTETAGLVTSVILLYELEE